MIVCKSPAEIERMRAANALVADVLAELEAMAAPGVTTADLDARAESLVRDAGAEPAFKGYRGYPASLCASVNEQVVHGIPSARALVSGDIVSLDMGVKLNGFYGDTAVTVPVGTVDPEVLRLLRITQESLEKGIAQVRVGSRVSDIGHAIQRHVEAGGSRWCGSSWGTASARRCTRIRRSPITVSPAMGRGWPRGWSWRLSRW